MRGATVDSVAADRAPPVIEAAELAAFEQVAAALAARAGARIAAALAGEVRVSFKPPAPGAPANSNPVSQVDQDTEAFIRAELAARFPGHAVVGEEFEPAGGAAPADAAAARVRPEATSAGRGSSTDPVPTAAARFTWVIDPVDGTSNFINGLPLFGCSLGLLCGGWPVAGAIWCSATHRLGPGVYHARTGGGLRLDGEPVVRRGRGSWRGLGAEHGRTARFGMLWDTRVLGTATLEFAWVAAGLLRHAFIPGPRLWDVAAGLVLVRAAGCQALTLHRGHWAPLVYFAGSDPGQLAAWHHPVLIGDEAAVAQALPSAPKRV